MQQEFEPIFAAAGCAGSLCVQDASGQVEMGIAPDQPFVAASVIKVLVAVEVERQLAAGRLDPYERVRLSAKARTPGPVGFSFYEDDVDMSLRDLLVPMLTISDNVATDALLARVGLASCNATATTLGLHQTVIEHDLHTMIDSIAQAAGFANWDALVARDAQTHTPDEEAFVQERVRTAAAMQPQTATRTTAHDMCRLLHLIWTDQATSEAGCRHIRSLMARQLTRHRLAAAFAPPVRVAAKSGSLLGVYRHEIGVIAYPDGRWYAAAVFTRTTDVPARDGAINAAIGQAAARAMELLARQETEGSGQ